MCWEKRGAREYYYRKSKVGGRVISEYIGCGSLAQSVSLNIEKAKAYRERSLNLQKKVIQVEADLSQEIHQCRLLTSTLTEAILLISGYHSHKGEWRKKR
jgi:hypothetical protein